MCAICRRYICPSACPSFEGASAELGRRLSVCTSCGGAIYESDEYVINYGKPYCKRCAERLDEEQSEVFVGGKYGC